MTEAHAEYHSVIIDRLTVIGFFPPVKKSDLEKNDDLNEALSDFQYHLRTASQLLKKKHVNVVELYAKEFTYIRDRKKILFIPEQEVGYLIVSPKRSQKTIYGVMTDDEIRYSIDVYSKEK